MSFFFDEKNAKNSLGETSWSTGNRTSYLENFRSSFDADYKTGRFDSEQNNLRNEYSLLVDTLNKKGYTAISNPVQDFEDAPLGPEDPREVAIRENEKLFEPTQQENIISFWEEVKKISELNPEIARELASLGYDNEENFKNTIGAKTVETWQKNHEISDRANFLGKVGQFAGSFSALGTDSLVLASLPFGAVYNVPKTALAAMARTAWVEGLIGAAVEIPIQIKAQAYRDKLGLPNEIELFGKKIPLGVFNVATVGVGSATLGAALQGVVKGVGGSVQLLRKELNKASDAEIEQVANALKIDKPEDLIKTKLPENPFEENKTTNIINTKNHDAAQHAVLNDKKIDFIETDAAPNKKSVDEIMSDSSIYKPEEIDFDPVNFQYKTDGDASGVSKKLANVTEWDAPSAGTILVYEFKNGKKAVVDGHQRLGLAKRLSKQGKKIKLLAYTIREADNVLPEAAMIKGLLMNLRNNTGTAIDAAKILRSKFGADWNTISQTLPARSNLVKNTDGLIKLSDDAWGMVSNNTKLENLGSRVGSIIEDSSLHANVIKILKDKKFTNLTELEQTLRLTNTLPKTVTKQDSLFGTDFFAETLLVERSQLLNWAKKNVTRKTQAFKTIVENDKTLQQAGNKLNKLNNEEQRLLYEEVGNRVEQVALQHGELSDQLTKAAQLLKEGKRTDAEKLFSQAIDDAAQRGDFRGNDVSGSIRTNQTEVETPAIPEKFEEDLTTNKLFDDPNVGSKDQISELSETVLGEGISKSISDEVGNGAIVSTSPAVKSLSINQDLATGSQRTNATPPSTVFAADTASPPSFLTDATKVVGDTSSITKRIIYHNTNDLNKIKDLAKKNYDGYLNLLNKFKKKHNAEIEISIKDDKSLAEKLKTRGPEHISDILRARIDVDTIDQARAVAQDIKNTVKTIEFDDFMKLELDPKRVDSGYRGIHTQLLLKDGITAELQIRLKSTKNILTRSHKLYKMKADQFKTAKGAAAFQIAKDQIKAELDDAYFVAMQRQTLASDELIDESQVVGSQIIDGEEVPITKTNREFVEDYTKEKAALERLKDCT